MSNNNRQRAIAGISRLAENKAKEWKALDSESYPCSIVSISDNGAMVTVKIELEDLQLPEIEMPVFMFGKVRFPIAIGDKGIARASNRYLGGVSGLGGGTANDTIIGNLTGYQFEPISNTDWIQVKTEFLTVLTDISDNVYRFTATRLHDKSADIIAKINELVVGLNTTNATINALHDTALKVDYQILPPVDTNLTEDN